MDLMYDKLFYNLHDTLSNKYGIWGENIPQNIMKYVYKKSLLLEIE